VLFLPIVLLFLTGAPTPTQPPRNASPAPIALPADKAKELKDIFDAAVKANQALQLAQKDWEAKYNAWVAAEYKSRYELNVPREYVLNLETAAFEFKPVDSEPGPASGKIKASSQAKPD
jgi:hypothetical protein